MAMVSGWTRSSPLLVLSWEAWKPLQAGMLVSLRGHACRTVVRAESAEDHDGWEKWWWWENNDGGVGGQT